MRYIISADPRLDIEKPHEITAAPEVVYFIGEINEETAASFRRDLEISEYNAVAAGQKILPICIDTPGGCLYSLMSMLDAIDACSLTVATVIEGKAFSAGIILAASGDPNHRYMGPNATIMIHSASGGSQGTVEEVENDTRELRRLYDKALKRMAKSCGKKEGFFISQIKEKGPEWYIEAKEAKKLKLISHIGIPVLETHITYTHELKLK